MLRRNWSAGELRVLLIALLIAVASVTTVGFFADRVQAALDAQANDLIGGDLVLIADKPIPDEFFQVARAAKLDVPVYIHPSPVKPALVEAFFKDHAAGL